MHRKLTHSVRAIAVAFGLLAVIPMIGTVNRVAGADALDGRAEAHIIPAEIPAKIGTDESEPVKAQRHRRKQARDAMALPFVSFAQVLRRGNGG